MEFKQAQSKPITNRLEEIENKLDSLSKSEKRKLKKELKIPRKAKVSTSRRKKGYCGVLFLDETRNIKGERVQLEGGTYKTKDGNYHVSDGSELFFWDGKYPLLVQKFNKLNPTSIFLEPTQTKLNDGTIVKTNEVYGQDTIKLRMKKDLIQEKKKGGTNMLVLIAILVGGYFVLKALFPHLLGG